MSDERLNILVTTAWPYCNGDLHIGHIAGAYLGADIFARYQRLRAITVRAEEEGITPREVVDRYHPRIIRLWQELGISFDLYTETDTENHWRVSQDFFLTHLQKGYIYKDTMRQWFCLTDQQFLADRYVEGTCPYCTISATIVGVYLMPLS